MGMRRLIVPPPVSFTLADARGIDVGTRESFLTFARKSFLGAPWWMMPGKPQGPGPGLGPFRAMRKVSEIEAEIAAAVCDEQGPHWGEAIGPLLLSDEDWRLCVAALEEPGEVYNPRWFRPCLPFASALVEAERVVGAASPVRLDERRRRAEVPGGG